MSIPTSAASVYERRAFVAKQLELLALRSFDLADRVAGGEIKFLDAVNVLYDGAVASGLVDAVGDDIVQATLAAAFASVERRR